MSDREIGNPPTDEHPLPRRDWVLIPLLVVLTIAVIACAVEGLARILLPESTTKVFPCLVLNDPSTGVRAIPNTECAEQKAETELVHYKFNSCGHRAGMECGPKPAGTYRIVLIGSSSNYGMWVPRDESFAALLPEELSRRTGLRIELYNEAMEWVFPRIIDLRFKEVLAEQPDMILWPLSNHDIESVDFVVPDAAPVEKNPGATGPMSAIQSKFLPEFIRVGIDHVKKSLFDLVGFKPGSIYGFKPRSIYLIRHLLFTSQSQYVKQFLMQRQASDFLRSEPDADFKQHLAEFSGYFADMKRRAEAIGAIMVVTTLPARAQAAMISMNEWPEGYDPYRLGEEIRSIVVSNGGTYVDILHAYRNIPDPEQGYFPVDGHPNVDGHALISHLLADALTDGAVPRLKADHLQTVGRLGPER